MLPTTTHSAPSVGDFIPYPEYEATTPESFHNGKPVLRYHATGVKVCVPKDQLASLPIFPADAPVFEGDSGELAFQEDVELFINSQDLAIFNHKTNTGIQIPYPTIALHAMQHKAQPSTGTTNGDSDASKAPCVLLQLDLSDGGEDDETYDTVQLTLVPPTASTQFESPAQDGAQSPSEQEKMFDAITTCQNLHPDPAAAEDEDDDDDDDQDYSDRIIFEPALDFAAAEAVEGLPGVFRGTRTGDLPPPMPGSSTWITAENVNEFFDEDGNWVGAGGVGNENEDEDEEKEGEGQEGRKEPEVEQLGPGAGRVRPLDEINGQEQAADESESKRARVE